MQYFHNIQRASWWVIWIGLFTLLMVIVVIISLPKVHYGDTMGTPHCWSQHSSKQSHRDLHISLLQIGIFSNPLRVLWMAWNECSPPPVAHCLHCVCTSASSRLIQPPDRFNSSPLFDFCISVKWCGDQILLISTVGDFNFSGSHWRR